MVISQLVAITGAKLMNQPSICAVEGLSFSTDKVRRGDLFIARRQKDIKQAVRKGAFAILFDGDYMPIDNEIAWLYAKDLELACGSLGRYLLIHYGLRCVVLDDIECEIAAVLFSSDSVIVAKENRIAFLEQLSMFFNLEHDEGIDVFESKDRMLDSNLLHCVCATADFFKYIDMESNKIAVSRNLAFRLFSSSLFVMRVFYNGHMYSLQLPAFLFKHIKRLLMLAMMLEITVDLESLNTLESMRRFSFNSNGYIDEYNAGMKTLLVLHNHVYFASFIKYLEENARWAHKMYLFSKKWDIYPKKEYVLFDNPKEAIAHIKRTHAHIVLLCCSVLESKNILSAFENHQKPVSLFE